MRIATTLLASCALMVSVSASSVTPPSHCSGGTCELTIIVPAGCGSGIQVAPNPVRIGSGSEPTTMKWVIRTKGWKFDSNGIAFDPPSGFFKTEAKAPLVDNLPTFTVVNQHTTKAPAKGLFKYDINLEGPDGKCKHDPTVINQ
jgi:hypothetical protein